VDDLIEVLVRESKPDFTTGQYKIVLKDKASDLVLSIWVGYLEGNSIALALEDSWAPRPMTHDRLKILI
jgi:bifunctional DNase/RNase